MESVRTRVDVQERTLERLMTEYGDCVVRVCFLFLKDRQLAQDASQETFIKAWRALDSLREDGAEKAWLMKIAVNTCRNMVRSRYFRMVDRSVSTGRPARAIVGGQTGGRFAAEGSDESAG